MQDFLEGLYRHLISTLANEGLSTNEVDYQVLFTVPAPFSSAAVENFRRIVMGTGFGNHSAEVQLTEPEAAALYTLKTQPIMRRMNGFEVGSTRIIYFRQLLIEWSQNQQCFVVCDAGGGTIDLSSYSITQLQPTIRVEQTGIVDGMQYFRRLSSFLSSLHWHLMLGGVFGSTLVDKAFQRFLKARLGENTIRCLADAEKDMMLDAFIEQKERFVDATYENNIVSDQYPRCSIRNETDNSG